MFPRPSPRYILRVVEHWLNYIESTATTAHRAGALRRGVVPNCVRHEWLEHLVLEHLRARYPEPPASQENLKAFRAAIQRLVERGKLVRVAAHGNPSPRGFYVRRTSLLEQLAIISQGGTP